jgi:hypothetical protein
MFINYSTRVQRVISPICVFGQGVPLCDLVTERCNHVVPVLSSQAPNATVWPHFNSTDESISAKSIRVQNTDDKSRPLECIHGNSKLE